MEKIYSNNAEKPQSHILNVVSNIGSEISWDNFEVDENTGREWKTTEVLYCKLDWVKENIQAQGNTGELLEAIEQTQRIMTAIADTEKTEYKVTNQ